MLEQIGWRADMIDGGYRTYRRLVNAALYDTALPHRLIALDGYTGTAKTELLHLLSARGVQVLDLEGLACHRGSLLGRMPDGQPSQKAFESSLAQALNSLDPARPVLIEAESSKIGERIVPPSLWTAMKAAPRIVLTAPIEARTDYLVRAYDDVLSDATRLQHLLGMLRAFRGNAVVDDWFSMISAGDKHGLTRALMQQHYDPSYDKSRKAVDAEIMADLRIETLDPTGLEHTAARIERLILSVAQPSESDS